MSRKGKGIPVATMPTAFSYLCFPLVSSGSRARPRHGDRVIYADDSDLLQISETMRGTSGEIPRISAYFIVVFTPQTDEPGSRRGRFFDWEY